MVMKTPNPCKPHRYWFHIYNPWLLIPWEVGHGNWASIEPYPSSFTPCPCPANCPPKAPPLLALPHPWSLLPEMKRISSTQTSACWCLTFSRLSTYFNPLQQACGEGWPGFIMTASTIHGGSGGLGVVLSKVVPLTKT